MKTIKKLLTLIVCVASLNSFAQEAAKVLSIERQNPTTEITSASIVTFRVTFDEPVKNVDATDFTLNSTTGSINSVTLINTSVYDVEITGLSTAGSIGLDIKGVAGAAGSNDIITILQETETEVLSVNQIDENDYFNQAKLGQTFTATASFLTKFTIYPKAGQHDFSGTADLKIYSGDETAGGILLSTESITITNNTDSAGQTFTLSTPQGVTAGNIYSITLDNFSGSGSQSLGAASYSTDVYAGGHIIFTGYNPGSHSQIDLKIQVYESSLPETLSVNQTVDNDWFNQTKIGQTFTATASNLTKFTIYPRAGIHVFSGTADLNIYSGDETDGGLTPLFTQSINITNSTVPAGQTFILSMPQSVITGDTYSIVLDNFTGSGARAFGASNDGNTTDQYLGGHIIFTGYNPGTHNNMDLKIQIYESGGFTEMLSVNQAVDNDYFNQAKIGQTFTATASNLTKFTLYPRAGQHLFSGTADLKIYSGDETTGTATLLSTQNINITNSTASAGQTFTLSTPQSVITGTTYSIVLDNFIGSGNRAFGAHYSLTTDEYTGGHVIFTGQTPAHSNVDLKIKIYESGIPVYDGPALATTAPAINQTYIKTTTPVVITTDASNINAITATLGGNVTEDNNLAITERGIVYSSSNTSPEIGGSGVIQGTNGTGTGIFSEIITGLTENTLYYYRAYAINSEGTSYGVQKTFITLNAANIANLVSIVRQSPTAEEIRTNTVTFRATFNQTVLNVDATDFTVISTSGSINSVIPISTSIYDVEVTGLPITGSIGLGIKGVAGAAGTNNIVSLLGDGISQIPSVNIIGDNNWFNQNMLGQTFTATTSNYLTEFKLYPEAGIHTFSGTADLKIYSGDETGALLFTQIINITDSTDSQGQLFTLTIPQSVSAGSVYSIVLDNFVGSGDRAFDGSSGHYLYTGGFMILPGSSNSDFHFLKITIYEGGIPFSDGYPLETTAPTTNEAYIRIATPIVATTSTVIIDVLDTYATLGGNVTDDYGFDVTERGIVYSSTATIPEIGETGVTKDTNGVGTGVFLEIITGLTENTLYYYRAYAINSDGTNYGTVKRFTTQNAAKVLSVERQNPTTEETAASNVLFRVTFDSPVNNVDATDFTVNATSGSINSVTPISTSEYAVGITGLSTAGTIGLDIKGVAGAAGTNNIKSILGDGIPEVLSVNQIEENNWFTQAKIGQTFTATSSLNLSKFTVYPKAGVHTFSGTADLKIYSGDETTGAATLLSAESITITAITDSAGQTFTLNAPQSVTAGNTYSIVLDNFSGGGHAFEAATYAADQYAGGHLIFTGYAGETNYDLKIQIYESGTPFSDGLPLATTAPTTNETYTKTTAKIISIERQNPTTEEIRTTAVTFRTTFDIPVKNVDATDFTLNATSGSINSVTPISTSVYDVEITGLSTTGSIDLEIKGVAGAAGTNNILTLRGDGIPETLSVNQIEENNHFNQAKIGQTFTATSSLNLSKFTVYPKDGVHIFSGTADLKIYSGDETTGAATLLSVESITITASTDSAGQTFTLSTPQNLTAGNIYSIVLNNFSGSDYAFEAATYTTDYYAGGHLIYTGYAGQTNYDLKIQIYESGTPFYDGLALATTAPTTNEAYIKVATPIVATTTISNVADAFATFGGNVTDDYGFDVTERGVVYSVTDTTPEIGDTGVTKDINGIGIGVFSEIITGLTENTLYYYRAYAINSDGTNYGEVKTFTTLNTAKIISIERLNPTTEVITTSSVIFRSTFDTSVKNVDATDFTLNSTSGSISSITPISTSVYDVEITGLSTAGSIGLDIKGVAGAVGTNDIIAFYGDGNSETLSIDQTADNDYFNQAKIGQTFTATLSKLIKFTVYPKAGQHDFSGTADLKIYSGDETAGGILLSTESITISNSTDSAGQTFTLSTPQDVTAGNTYSITLDNFSGTGSQAFGAAYYSSDVYAGGHVIFTGYNPGSHSQIDLTIQIYEEGTPFYDGSALATTAPATNETYTKSGMPTVITTDAINIAGSTATLGGNVTVDFGFDITERGIVYSSTDTTPEIGETGVTKDTNGVGLSNFSEIITGLTGETLYYYKAYAINSEGTSYGTVKTFTTLKVANIVSIERLNPTTEEITTGGTVTFRVTFDTHVKNVDAIDFTLNTTVGGSINSVTSINTSVYDVEVIGLSEYLAGTIGLDIKGVAGATGTNDIITLYGDGISETLSVDQTENNNWFNQAKIGQTFTATLSQLTKFTIYPKAYDGANHTFSGTADLKIYSGDETAGGVLLSTESIAITANTDSAGQTFTLSTPQSVTTGNTYSIVLDNFSGSGDRAFGAHGSSSTDEYTGGHVIFTNQNSNHSLYDLTIKIYEEGTPFSDGSALATTAPTTNEMYTKIILPFITTTTTTSNVLATSAIFGGNVTGHGGFPVTERGIVYSASDTTPEIGETGVTKDDNGVGTGIFSEVITGLTINTIYYYRAYAINSGGTSYGDVKSVNINDNALNFQSNNGDLVNIPDNAAFDFSSGFTIENWVKPSAFTSNHTIFSQYGTTGLRAFGVIAKSDGSVEVSISTNGNDEAYYITANTLTLDTWQHVALTYDGTSIQFYINGIEAGMNGSITGTLNGAMFNSAAPILLGSRANSLFYDGDMDEVRVWTRALTATEINTQKDINIAYNSSGLVAYYKMNQGIAGGNNTTITTLIDSGPNGLHGVLTNFTRTGLASNFVVSNNSVLDVNESIFNTSEMPIIYPNPINDGVVNIKISYTLLVNNKLKYQIYNTIGKIIKDGVLTDVENQISVDYLASGIYMIKISSNEKSVVKKLVVK